jgi:hypothetical protein
MEIPIVSTSSTSTKALSPPKIDRHKHKNREAALRSIAQRRLSWCGFIISELAKIEDVENHLIFQRLISMFFPPMIGHLRFMSSCYFAYQISLNWVMKYVQIG